MFALLITRFLPFTLAIGTPGQACPLPSANKFFFLPPWWEYLNGAYDQLGKCSPSVSFPHVVLPIGLALIDIMIRVAGLVAIVSIIIAGIGYVTSGGNAENAAKARGRIYNALIGLAIVFVAAGLVAFIGNSLGG